MSTMEMSTSSNGRSSPISGDSMPDTLLLSSHVTSAKSVHPPSGGPLPNGNSSASSANTVCYLANGAGQIDRLNLVLPLTNSSSAHAYELSMLSTSPPFSSHDDFYPAMSHSQFQSDTDRTPINTEHSEGSFVFMPTPLNQSSSFSSCRTVDSGTESICSDSIDDCPADIGTDRILKFFATDNSKSSRFATRRPTGGGTRQTSTDDDEDIFSDDESTLSESSLSPQEFTSTDVITPESVVAAIDKQIKQREASDKMVTRDKDTSDEQAATSDSTNNDNHTRPHEEQLSSPTEIDALISSEERKRLEEIANNNKPEHDDNLDDDDDDDDECPRIPLIRSTSLKTGKTPPGTPGGKKFVRFADALGLDLESVRHIVDDVPYMPPLAAFKGLKLDDDEKRWLFDENTQQSPILNQGHASFAPSQQLLSKPNLRVLFCQPSSDPGPFLERVRSYKLCLENCMVTGPSGPSDLFTITCIVRVLNVGFEKSVMLRFTTNEWLTWTDVLASYVPNSCDGFSDKFTVTFHLAVNSNGHHSMMPGQRLLFALKYTSNGQEFWDNNMGLNYALIYQRS